LDQTRFTITVLIILLLIASAVAMITKWVRVPYTLALVIVGLVISPMHLLPPVHMSPDLILLIFLPALLFEAAWNLDLSQLRANLLPIASLAIIGVGLAVGIMGLILHYAISLPWSSALLFGAIVSATDPISVLALFRKLGAPERLTVIVEGESLFNDGVAVVVFRMILAVIIGAAAYTSMGALVGWSIAQFVIVVVGGLALGTAVGFLVSTLARYFNDHLLEITLTTIAAYGSYLIAEAAHVSAVITVIACGFVVGNYGRRKGMSRNTELAVNSFWEYAAFVVNSLVFLLIGLEIPLSLLASDAIIILWAILAMTLARGLAIYSLFPIIHRFTTRVPGRWQHVLFWGGLRGSLSIALVLSIPLAMPGRVQLVAMTFGVVTFSLLVQGLTVSPLLTFLKINQKDPGLI
jgi:monovalent cation:H+ antiporter, CPA1 family